MSNSNKIDRFTSFFSSQAIRCGVLAAILLLGGFAYPADAFQMPELKDKQVQDNPQKVRRPVDPGDLGDLDDPNDLPLDKEWERKRQDFERMKQEMEKIRQQQLDRMNQDLQRALEAFQRQRVLEAQNPNLLQGRFPVRDNGTNARLGARVSHPSDVLADQLDLPRGQGLVIEQLSGDSAAEKAGMKVNDILLELNGKPVADNPTEFARQLTDIKANDPVDAVVMRKGRKETLKGLSLPEARAEVPQPLPPQPGLRLPAMPILPGRVGGAVSVTRNNDQFKVRQAQNGEVLTVSGRVAEGKTVIEEVIVESDGKTTKYDSIEKVPEAQRATAQTLADMAGVGRIRIGR